MFDLRFGWWPEDDVVLPAERPPPAPTLPDPAVRHLLDARGAAAFGPGPPPMHALGPAGRG